MVPENRTFRTPADLHYQKFKKIPLPEVMHTNLESLIKLDNRDKGDDGIHDGNDIMTEEGSTIVGSKERSRILVIGDVYGCLDELKALVQNAVTTYNNNQPFASIILVGDLCNKGPKSAEVVKYVRKQKHWFTVRGNHDDGALAVLLGDKERLGRSKYHWIIENEDERKRILSASLDEEQSSTSNGWIPHDEVGKHMSLSDDDVDWLANLLYTISIPNCNFVGEEKTLEGDTIVVHAGFIPGVPLESQEIETMTTVRDICPGNISINQKSISLPDDSDDGKTVKKYWALLWSGPQHVIFGHDAKRGCVCCLTAAAVVVVA
jgi:bis(5'-nucleosyl)-tetraphosphatase (symmetrical)